MNHEMYMKKLSEHLAAFRKHMDAKKRRDFEIALQNIVVSHCQCIADINEQDWPQSVSEQMQSEIRVVNMRAAENLAKLYGYDSPDTLARINALFD